MKTFNSFLAAGILVGFCVANPFGITQSIKLSIIPEARAFHEAAPGETKEEKKARRQAASDARHTLSKIYRNYEKLCRDKYGVDSSVFGGRGALSGCVQTEMNRDEDLGRILLDPITLEYEYTNPSDKIHRSNAAIIAP